MEKKLKYNPKLPSTIAGNIDILKDKIIKEGFEKLTKAEFDVSESPIFHNKCFIAMQHNNDNCILKSEEVKYTEQEKLWLISKDINYTANNLKFLLDELITKDKYYVDTYGYNHWYLDPIKKEIDILSEKLNKYDKQNNEIIKNKIENGNRN